MSGTLQSPEPALISSLRSFTIHHPSCHPPIHLSVILTVTPLSSVCCSFICFVPIFLHDWHFAKKPLWLNALISGNNVTKCKRESNNSSTDPVGEPVNGVVGPDLHEAPTRGQRTKQLVGGVQRVTCNSTVVSETGGSGDGLQG